MMIRRERKKMGVKLFQKRVLLDSNPITMMVRTLSRMKKGGTCQ